MNKLNKLYLFLSLSLATRSINTQEHEISSQITSCKIIETIYTKNHHELIQTTEENVEELSIEEKIDQELYKVFNDFFNDHDKTPFSKIVAHVINLLKRKKSTLHGQELIKCDEMIKLLETHAADYRFYIWANILTNPELLDLMSNETKTYIVNISNQKKITSLIRRLRNTH